MAHVEKFSHLTIPMLWFEISLNELPKRLERRFDLYLNLLPMVEKSILYGSFALGIMLSIIAVSRVALRTSISLTSQNLSQKFNRNLANNSVYNPCEEKLIALQPTKAVQNKVTKVNELSKSDEESSDSGGGLNMITRSQYELEDDDALSDIDYTEVDEESASTASTSSGPVCKFFSSSISLFPIARVAFLHRNWFRFFAQRLDAVPYVNSRQFRLKEFALTCLISNLRQ